MLRRLSNPLLFLALFSLLASRAAGQAPRPFTVGMILPLSGGAAEYGSAMRNGIQMAVQDQPEAFSGLRWLYEDSRYDSNAAVSAFRKITAGEEVDLVYVFGGPMSDVLAPLAEQAQVPLLVSINEPRTAIGRRYVIRFSNPAQDYGRLIGAWLQKRRIHSVAVIKAENQYLNCMLDGLTSTLPAGIALKEFPTDPAERDFRTIISRIKAAAPGAIGVYLLPGQVGPFFRQLRDQNLQAPAFGADFFESLSEIQDARGAMDGAVYPNNTVSPEFRERYRREHGQDSQITWAGYGYDFAVTVAAAAKIAGPDAPDQLIAALRASPARDGVMGRLAYVESPHGDRFFRFPVVMKFIQGEIVSELKE